VLLHVVLKVGCCNELSELQCCGVEKNVRAINVSVCSVPLLETSAVMG
jgi:hypothetical protein